MNPVNLLQAQPGHTQLTDFTRQDEDAHENRPQHDNEDGDSRGLDELVTWLRSLAAHNVVDIRDAEDKESENESNPQPVDGKPQKKRTRRGKTPFQQEYNRISQRERRQEKRRQKRREKQTEEGAEVDDGDTGDFPLLWVIYLAHEKNGQLRKEFPKWVQKTMDGADVKESVKEYMRNYDESNGPDFSCPKELEDYLVIKRRELISLKRRLMVKDRTEKHYDERLQAVDDKLGGLKKNSKERERTFNEERLWAVSRLAVVRHAADVLPILLEGAKNRVQELTPMAKQAYEIRMLREEEESLDGQLSDGKKKLHLLKKQIKHVVPRSEPYNEMSATLCKVEERNEDLEKQIKKVRGDLDVALTPEEG